VLEVSFVAFERSMSAAPIASLPAEATDCRLSGLSRRTRTLVTRPCTPDPVFASLGGDPRVMAVWARDRRIDYRRRSRKRVARPPAPATTLVIDRVNVADPSAAAHSEDVANAPNEDIRRVEVNAVIAVLDYSVNYLRSVRLVQGEGRKHAAALPNRGDRIDLEPGTGLLTRLARRWLSSRRAAVE
jgi:hypothetical protein